MTFPSHRIIGLVLLTLFLDIPSLDHVVERVDTSMSWTQYVEHLLDNAKLVFTLDHVFDEPWITSQLTQSNDLPHDEPHIFLGLHGLVTKVKA